MTKAEMILAIQKKNGGTKTEAERIFDVMSEVIDESLQNEGDKISFPGVLSIYVFQRADRRGRNPRTGKPMDIPAQKVLKIAVSKAKKERLN